MTGARRRAFLLAILVAAVLAAIFYAGAVHRRANVGARPGAHRPTLLLLTSLPLLFSDDFSLDKTGSPALRALERRYRVVPISVADPAELAKGRMLLMAQPFAQPAEDLIALDDWVRGGGRLLLFADPMLEWPSEKPLGDLTRAPLMFADTGLLGHWGLRLDAPDSRGLVVLGHGPITYDSPGRLVALGPNCNLSRSNIVADCRIGRGRVTVVADADMLNIEALASLGRPEPRNSQEILDMLAALEPD